MSDNTTKAYQPKAEEYLTQAEAAALLRIGRRSLERWRRSGDGPAWIRAGLRRVLYSRDALIEWAERHTYAHRAAELASKSQIHR